jgi:hypothetical protein
MDDLSFLMINTMISMSVPGIASMISGVLINLIYFDILYTEKWFPDFMESIKFVVNTDDHPINVYFDQNGFQSLLIIKNLGSTLFFILFYLIAWILLLILKIASIFIDKVGNAVKKLETVLMWNGTITMMMSQFAPMIISSLINLYAVKWESNIFFYSSVLSIALLVLNGIGILFFSFILLKAYFDLEWSKSERFNRKYSVLIDGLRIDTIKYRFLVLFWKPLNLLRWLSTILALVFMRDYPGN